MRQVTNIFQVFNCDLHSRITSRSILFYCFCFRTFFYSYSDLMSRKKNAIRNPLQQTIYKPISTPLSVICFKDEEKHIVEICEFLSLMVYFQRYLKRFFTNPVASVDLKILPGIFDLFEVKEQQAYTHSYKLWPLQYQCDSPRKYYTHTLLQIALNKIIWPLICMHVFQVFNYDLHIL